MAKKFALCLLCLDVLAVCGSANKDYAIKDPIFRNSGNDSEDNRIIFREDGRTDYLMRDPLWRYSDNDSRDNRILFREPKK